MRDLITALTTIINIFSKLPRPNVFRRGMLSGQPKKKLSLIMNPNYVNFVSINLREPSGDTPSLYSLNGIWFLFVRSLNAATSCSHWRAFYRVFSKIIFKIFCKIKSTPNHLPLSPTFSYHPFWTGSNKCLFSVFFSESKKGEKKSI